MKIKQAILTLLFFTSLMTTLLFSAQAISKTNDMSGQLSTLVKVLEKKRIEHHIPGMAIAVVKNDKIILSKGFGVLDIENQTPVTPETLFSIGSSSKAFTATMLGMLVDQEQLSWDQHVSEQLPNYQFNVDGKDLPITYRDMLSHRTGYTRNDLLWANGKASRAEILTTATQAEPVDDFRKKFYYNNVMYLAAGEAIATVKGQSWDELLNQMILKPLGMNKSTSIHEQAITTSNISLGYQWNTETEKHDFIPRRNLNNVAPAGGIYSNVNDMAQWVRFQLNQGKATQATDSMQLISTEQLQQTHEEQIKIAGDVGYGMGWMLRKWQNHTVVEHGGNVDGYGAQVAMLPESSLGFVLLTNVTASPLQQESMSIIWEHLANQEVNKPVAAVSTDLDYQEYIGEYDADFGPFKDATFTFLVKEDGVPAVDVPGQTIYELLNPDKNGKWFFKMTNTISLSFDRDHDSGVVAMRMQQNGMNYELPRKGYQIKSEVEPGAFDQFLGQYESKKLNGNIKAFVQNHRLTMDVPDQMAFELHLPDENGFRQFRIKSDTSVKFVTNEEGNVTGVELYVNKEQLVETAPKIESSEVVALPSISEVLELRKTNQRIKALKENSGFSLNGDVNVKSSGIRGHVMTQFDDDMNLKLVMDFGVFGGIINIMNKDSGATYGIHPYTELKGKYLKQAQRESPIVGIDWEKHYDEIKVIAVSTLDTKQVIEVRLKDNELPAATAFVDSNTGDVVQLNSKLLIPSIGSVNLRIEYDDFREHHGLRIPFKTVIYNPMMGEVEIIYSEFNANIDFNESAFDTKKPN